MPRLSVPLTDEQHRAIRAKAFQAGIPQAEVARRLLLAWLAGDDAPNPWVQRLTVAFAKLEVDGADREALASIAYVGRELLTWALEETE